MCKCVNKSLDKAIGTSVIAAILLCLTLAFPFMNISDKIVAIVWN